MTHDQGPIHPLDEKAKAEITANRTRKLDTARVRLLELFNPSTPDSQLSYGAVFKRIAPLTARLQRILGYVDYTELSGATDSEGNTCFMNPMGSETPSSDAVLGIQVRKFIGRQLETLIDLDIVDASVTTTNGISTLTTRKPRWYCDGNTEKAMAAAELVVDAMISPYEEALNLSPLTNVPETPEMQALAHLFSKVDSSPALS